MTGFPDERIDPAKAGPAPPAPPPLPLDYFPRRAPRSFSRGHLLTGGALFIGSLFFGAAGTYAVLRIGGDARYSLLSAVIAPIVFAAGLGGVIHSTDMVREAVRRRDGAGRPGGGPPGETGPPSSLR